MNDKLPSIRFKEFTDDWEQRKVYEIADRFDNLRVPVAANLRVAGETPYYGANGIQDYVDGYTHDGEYVLVAEDGASDLKNYPVNYVNGRIWVNNHAHVLQGKNNIASNRFLSYAISLANIESVLVGGGRAKLNADVMMNLNIDLPTYKEQCRVAEYFSNLDNLITLHQRKYDHLLNIKKSMLEKMFPKNGKKAPEIRFDGFTDDWEQRKFSELCDMVTVGIANSATHAYSDSGIVMFRNQNIKPNFLDDNDIIHIKPEFESRYKNKRLKKNDLLVARTGYPGTTCVVPEKYENSQTFTTLIARPKNSVNPYFLCQYLNSDIGVKYFESTQIGGGQKNSGAGILNEMPVMLPSGIEEESKIAEYFTNFDNLITLHQRKLEKLQNLKISMLKQMFL